MTPSAVSGMPRVLLRAEGAALFIVSTILYAKVGASWWLFAILFLSPDISFIGYLGGPRVGSTVYNAAHTLVGPLLLVVAGLLWPVNNLVPLALIWIGHIGFDRFVGYGLKYAAGFGFTHLGHVGRTSD